MTRLRILVLAYMVSPVRGTEYAVAWNYIQTMRVHCDLTVMYGAAGTHMGDHGDFAEPDFVDAHPAGDVRFTFVAEPRLARWLNALNRRGIFTYSFYLAYRVWHRAAFALAKKLLASEQYDLIHYVGPIGYREPGYLWDLPLPYVWGPIGGATSFPWQYRKTMPLKGQLRLIFRTVGNAIQLHFGRRVRHALRRTDVLFTATTENQAIFANKGISSIYIPENGIDSTITLNLSKFPVQALRVAWIGSLEARKALALLLEAVARLRDPTRVIVDVYGDGPLREHLHKQAVELEISRQIVWHGHVPRRQVLAGLDRSHLHVVTGLNEANTTSMWEAMGRSVPILALDHCGMHDVVQPPYGMRVPVTDVETTVTAITDALEELLAKPERLEAMARSCADACDRFRIVHRPAVFLDAYRAAIARFGVRHPK